MKTARNWIAVGLFAVSAPALAQTPLPPAQGATINTAPIGVTGAVTPGGGAPVEPLPSGAVISPSQVPNGAIIHGAPATAQQQQQQLPPPPRELTPQELARLRSGMVSGAVESIMTPGEIGAIRDRALDAQGAQARQNYSDQPMPIPRPRSIIIPDRADRVPETIRLAFGVVSPVTFLDSRGRPWPIASVGYDPRVFAADGAGCGGQVSAPNQNEGQPTTVLLSPCRYQAFGNITVKLDGYPQPIVIMLKSGFVEPVSRVTAVDKTTPLYVDVPVTVRLAGTSPLSILARPRDAAAAGVPRVSRDPYNETGMEMNRRGRVMPDRELERYLSGVPPHGARRVGVSGDPSVEAYVERGRLYLVGDVTVVNPAHDAQATSPAGNRVWRFNRMVSRVLVIDRDGAEKPLLIDF